MRPIALFAAMYRLWGKCRRPVADQWEAAHDRAFFAMGTGRIATDAVWRAAVNAALA